MNRDDDRSSAEWHHQSELDRQEQIERAWQAYQRALQDYWQAKDYAAMAAQDIRP